MTNVQLVHGEKTAALPDGTTLLDLIQEKCPHLHGPDARYKATSYLFNGHLQTGYASMYKGTPEMDLISYDRQYLPFEDGGAVALDYFPALNAEEVIDKPMVVFLHGLTGGSHESYIRGVIDKLTDVADQYQTVVINNRGCGFSELRTDQLYSGIYTEDVRRAFTYLHGRLKPGVPMIAIGFSLGANILCNYLGQEGDRTPVSAAISVANPFDFTKTAHCLESSTFHRNVYSSAMATNLKNLYQRHEALLSKNPKIDNEQILLASTLREFDDACTRRMFDYPSVDAYYEDASSDQRIGNVRIPLLCLNALDDPIAHHSALPFRQVKENPNVVLALTSQGGHIGWFEYFVSPTRWVTKPIVEFIAAISDVLTPTYK
ncbi:AB-hydrolase YheT [Hesseltinella vesiculosa]|uniref:AB-hydrolase YheT n=1 Tax=Hesseltinella vesiculosa TaxID=101127 RepID=A0A1X2GXA2_9FUNG|nr:AB-hydrolase YheT [Hesseltinella vesiculosa]